MRPHILITEREIPTMRSLAQVRLAVEHGHARALWQRMRQRVEEQLDQAPLLPTTPLSGRDPDLTRHANPDYVIVQAAAERVMEAALAALLAEERRYAQAALAQMEVLFDNIRNVRRGWAHITEAPV